MDTSSINAATAKLVNPGRHYAHAPIAEAVLDIHIYPTETPLQDLVRVQLGEEAEYPIRKTPMVLQWQVTGGPETVASATTQTQTGYAFVSKEGERVFQARRDGFSFNKIKPYDRWESFRDEARRLWTKYKEIAKPSAVRLLSLRYINRVDLPNPSELKEYFSTYPEVSQALPQQLNTFAMQLSLPITQIEATLLLNQAAVPAPSADLASVLLDLQVFVQVDKALEEGSIWQKFEEFRICKNQAFEACITDKLRERMS